MYYTPLVVGLQEDSPKHGRPTLPSYSPKVYNMYSKMIVLRGSNKMNNRVSATTRSRVIPKQTQLKQESGKREEVPLQREPSKNKLKDLHYIIRKSIQDAQIENGTNSPYKIQSKCGVLCQMPCPSANRPSQTSCCRSGYRGYD